MASHQANNGCYQIRVADMRGWKNPLSTNEIQKLQKCLKLLGERFPGSIRIGSVPFDNFSDRNLQIGTHDLFLLPSIEEDRILAEIAKEVDEGEREPSKWKHWFLPKER